MNVNYFIFSCVILGNKSSRNWKPRASYESIISIMQSYATSLRAIVLGTIILKPQKAESSNGSGSICRWECLKVGAGSSLEVMIPFPCLLPLSESGVSWVLIDEGPLRLRTTHDRKWCASGRGGRGNIGPRPKSTITRDDLQIIFHVVVIIYRIQEKVVVSYWPLL